MIRDFKNAQVESELNIYGDNFPENEGYNSSPRFTIFRLPQMNIAKALSAHFIEIDVTYTVGNEILKLEYRGKVGCVVGNFPHIDIRTRVNEIVKNLWEMLCLDFEMKTSRTSASNLRLPETEEVLADWNETLDGVCELFEDSWPEKP